MTLTIQLLNRFIEEILGGYEFKEFKDQALIDLIKVIDPTESFYHVDKKKIWKKSAWIKEEEHINKIRQYNKELITIRDKRIFALKSIQIELSKATGMEPELLFPLALNVLRNRKPLADILGVSLKDVPDMPENYSIIEGKNTYTL